MTAPRLSPFQRIAGVGWGAGRTIYATVRATIARQTRQDSLASVPCGNTTGSNIHVAQVVVSLNNQADELLGQPSKWGSAVFTGLTSGAVVDLADWPLFCSTVLSPSETAFVLAPAFTPLGGWVHAARVFANLREFTFYYRYATPTVASGTPLPYAPAWLRDETVRIDGVGGPMPAGGDGAP